MWTFPSSFWAAPSPAHADITQLNDAHASAPCPKHQLAHAAATSLHSPDEGYPILRSFGRVVFLQTLRAVEDRADGLLELVRQRLNHILGPAWRRMCLNHKFCLQSINQPGAASLGLKLGSGLERTQAEDLAPFWISPTL